VLEFANQTVTQVVDLLITDPSVSCSLLAFNEKLHYGNIIP